MSFATRDGGRGTEKERRNKEEVRKTLEDARRGLGVSDALESPQLQ